MNKNDNFQKLIQETELTAISPDTSSSEKLTENNSTNNNLNSLNKNVIKTTNDLDINKNNINYNNNTSRNETSSLNYSRLDLSRNTNTHCKNKNYKNLLKKQKLIFIPLISTKIILPIIYMNLYITDSFDNELDKKYCNIALWIFISVILYFYYLCIYTPTKQSNVDKYFDNERNIHIQNQGNEIQYIKKEFWKNCEYCNHSKKFLRSSHCRTCNKCVLLRDHHCPFIANCVGYDNIQYFTNFLFLGIFGLLFIIVSSINYYFSKNEKVINFKMPIIPKIILISDFVINILTVINLFSLLVLQLVNIYNNSMKLERMKNPLIDLHSPCCDCLINKSLFKCNQPYPNMYNIGYLANFYYIFGPTLCHYFFPLPKYFEFTLKENSPIFLGTKLPDRLSILKYLSKKDNNYVNILEHDECNPDYYIKKCHDFYDNKKII